MKKCKITGDNGMIEDIPMTFSKKKVKKEWDNYIKRKELRDNNKCKTGQQD